MTDCIVVGGGLIGMLTARELVLSGASVTLLEKGRVGTESSWAGGGILSPLYPWRYGEPVTALASWGQDRYPALLETLNQETGLDCQYRKSGLLIPETAELVQARGWAERHGRNLQVIDKKEIKAIEPAIGEVGDGGAWLPDVGQVRNPRLVQTLRAWIEPRIRLVEDCPMTGLETDGDRVSGIETPKGTFRAEKMIIAGGAWTADLFKQAGKIPEIRPIKGQMILFRAKPDTLQRMLLKDSRYVIPRRDGRILTGSTLEDVGFDKRTDAESKAELMQAAVALVPALADFPVEHHWAGLRPASPEGIPYISVSQRYRNLLVNAGHFRNGVVLAPASCRLAADLVLEREPILDPAPYRVDRD